MRATIIIYYRYYRRCKIDCRRETQPQLAYCRDNNNIPGCIIKRRSRARMSAERRGTVRRCGMAASGQYHNNKVRFFFSLSRDD